jgi:hypothetical protein
LTEETETVESVIESSNLTNVIESAINATNVSELNDSLREFESHPKNKVMRSKVFTERGNNSEMNHLDETEKLLGGKIYGRNDKFYKKCVQLESFNFTIGGRVDGLIDMPESTCVIEIKNRQFKIMDRLPIHEKIQLLVYMYLTGIPDCKHVQWFDGIVRVEDYPFDESLWLTVKNRLILFAEDLYKILIDESAADKLMSNDDSVRIDQIPTVCQLSR